MIFSLFLVSRRLPGLFRASASSVKACLFMFLLENSFRPVLKWHVHGSSCHNVTRRSSSAHVHSAAAIFVVNFVARWLASIRAWCPVCREHVVEVGIFLLLRLMIFFDGDWCRPSQLHSGHKKVGNWFVPDYRGSGAAWSKKGSRRLICVVAMSTWGHLYVPYTNYQILW